MSARVSAPTRALGSTRNQTTPRFSSSSRAQHPVPSWQSSGSLTGITFGAPVLGATHNTIDVEIPFTEAGGTIARAYVETRSIESGYTRQHLDMWPIRPTVAGDITQYGAQYALYSLTFGHNDGTYYEARAWIQDSTGLWITLAMGTVFTRKDNVPNASGLTPTRYVGLQGTDTTAGGQGNSSGLQWLTANYAWSNTPSGGICRFGPTFYGPATTGRTSPGIFVAQFPCRDDVGNEINQGQQSVIEPLTVSAPTGTAAWSSGNADRSIGSPNPYTVAPWVATTLTGTGETLTGGSIASPVAAQEYGGTGGVPDGTIWKWTSPPGTNIDSQGIAQVGYGTTRESSPHKIAFTRRDTSVCDVPGGWAEILHTSPDMRSTDSGSWQDTAGNSSTLYIRLPAHARRADGQLSRNPNDYWIKAGGESIGFDVNGNDIQLSGFKMHCHAWSVQTRHAIGRNIVDHCIFSMSQNGVRWGNGTAAANTQNYAAYTHDHIVQYCTFEEWNLWSLNPGEAIAWRLFKSIPTLQNGHTYDSSGGYSGAVTRWTPLENTACGGRGGGNRSIFRYNKISGYINGFSPCGSVSSEGRYSGYGSVAYGNYFENLADDTFEFDAQGLNQGCWDNVIRNALTFVSLGPTDLGPLYYFRNDVYLTRQGIGLKASEVNSAAANLACVMVKHSGGSSPRLLCYLVHNTIYSDQPDVWGPAEVASPTGNSEEAMWLMNNIMRLTGFLVRRDSTQPYTEDYNLMATNGLDGTANYGLRWNSVTYTDPASYRAISGMGAHSTFFVQTNLSAVDTVFTSPIARDFRLTLAARQILLGTPIPGISDNLLRLPVIGFEP